MKREKRRERAELNLGRSLNKNEGTGLGMPISKKDIGAHAGTLGITSRQGVGTEAKIRLPYKTDMKSCNRCQVNSCVV